jgi:hypothetical protein
MDGEWFPISEAAHRLGLSIDAMRRRVKRGEVRAEKRATPQGGAWWVQVTDTTPAAVQVAPDGARREVANGAIHQAPGGGDGATRYAPDGEIPRYAKDDSEWPQIVRDLTDRLDRANSELLLRTEAAAAWQGRAEILAAELARTREQLALMAPQSEMRISDSQPRPWWRFWRG